MTAGLGRLKTRPEFLLVAGHGRKWTTPGLILQARRRDGESASDAIRVGFTCSKKVGGAVERNRAKRRLRALASERIPQGGRSGTDYVLIGRQSTIKRPFDLLRKDLDDALRGVERAKR